MASTVHLYATPGADRDAFLTLVEAFNTRAASPTAWQVSLHDGNDPGELLQRLMRERMGNAVVLAGKNDRKLSTIAALHAAGLHVLADKPWATHGSATAELDSATAGGALAFDIMTSRHDVVARLRRALAHHEGIFGSFRPGSEPAIDFGSVHHLMKIVNGAPLRRPPWYYDVRVQGDGVVDLHSHMTDQAQWLLESEESFSFDADVGRLTAKRWATPVPLTLYEQSTGQAQFHPSVVNEVHDDVLALRCNGEVTYELRGISVRQRAEWRGVEPDGGGDLHSTVLRGTRADVIVGQGPDTQYAAALHVRPCPGVDISSGLTEAMTAWQSRFPGISANPSGLGFEISIPDAIRTSHETHFAMVLEEFLDYLDAGRWPAGLCERIRMRYTLLGHAFERGEDVDA